MSEKKIGFYVLSYRLPIVVELGYGFATNSGGSARDQETGRDNSVVQNCVLNRCNHSAGVGPRCNINIVGQSGSSRVARFASPAGSCLQIYNSRMM